jgi:hypothetical protein
MNKPFIYLPADAMVEMIMPESHKKMLEIVPNNANGVFNNLGIGLSVPHLLFCTSQGDIIFGKDD